MAYIPLRLPSDLAGLCRLLGKVVVGMLFPPMLRDVVTFFVDLQLHYLSQIKSLREARLIAC